MTLGTPQQLKAQYGTGYSITLQLSGDISKGRELVDETMKSIFDNLVEFDEPSSSATYRVYKVNTTEIKFGYVFEKLQSIKEASGLVDYSITQTTMDTVFKNFAKYQMGQ